MKAFRCVCFDCKSYCIPVNAGDRTVCNMCHSDRLARVGTAFRPPGKAHAYGWKKLEKVYAAQNANYLQLKEKALKNGASETDLKKMGLNKEKTEDLKGFGGASYHWDKKGKRMPKNLRESGYLRSIAGR